MRMLECARNATTAAQIGERAMRVRSSSARRLLLVPLAIAIIAAGSLAMTARAQAHTSSGGSVSIGSRSSAHNASGPRQLGASQSTLFMHRSHAHRGDVARFDEFDRAHGFRRFHHGNRDFFAGDFFPLGFWDWPWLQTDVAANVDASSEDAADWRGPPFWPRLDRYQPPTVEKSPSGVTIIRGPGSHHGY